MQWFINLWNEISVWFIPFITGSGGIAIGGLVVKAITAKITNTKKIAAEVANLLSESTLQADIAPLVQSRIAAVTQSTDAKIAELAEQQKANNTAVAVIAEILSKNRNLTDVEKLKLETAALNIDALSKPTIKIKIKKTKPIEQATEEVIDTVKGVLL